MDKFLKPVLLWEDQKDEMISINSSVVTFVNKIILIVRLLVGQMKE